MKLRYETFGDVTRPVFRSDASSNWDGEVAADAAWTDEICENLRFGNGFTIADFQIPSPSTKAMETLEGDQAM